MFDALQAGWWARPPASGATGKERRSRVDPADIVIDNKGRHAVTTEYARYHLSIKPVARDENDSHFFGHPITVTPDS